MRFHSLVVALVLLLPSLVSGQQQVLVLDCPVTRASPIFGLADLPEAASAILMERYRFTISLGDPHGIVTTPRANNIPAQVYETDSAFEIDFENKHVVIDRMTAEFTVSIRGAKQSLGSGICTNIKDRKF